MSAPSQTQDRLLSLRLRPDEFHDPFVNEIDFVSPRSFSLDRCRVDNWPSRAIPPTTQPSRSDSPNAKYKRLPKVVHFKRTSKHSKRPSVAPRLAAPKWDRFRPRRT